MQPPGPRTAVGALQSRLEIAANIVIAQGAGHIACGGFYSGSRACLASESALGMIDNGLGKRRRALRRDQCGNQRQTLAYRIAGEGVDLCNHRQIACQTSALIAVAVQLVERQVEARANVNRGHEIDQFHCPVIGFDLEAERGNAIAEIGELQRLEYAIGQAAKGRCVGTFVRQNCGIGLLITMAGVEPEFSAGLEVASATAQQIAVGPNPPDIADWSAR